MTQVEHILFSTLRHASSSIYLASIACPLSDAIAILSLVVLYEFTVEQKSPHDSPH